MDKKDALEILDALANGCHPKTGEIIENDSILNDRSVIRALQFAIDTLNNNESIVSTKFSISEADIIEANKILEQYSGSATSSKLVGLFLGTRKFKNPKLINNPLYGKYAGKFLRGELGDYLSKFFEEKNPVNRKFESWNNLEHFKEPIYNKLSEKAVDQLKEKVRALPLMKKDDLSEEVIKARLEHFRYQEPWSYEETQILKKALEYTNNLKVLSSCFGRTISSIASKGQILLNSDKK
ncbi:MAG: hypothetical protein RLZ33_72 [Bacteroidota bacterium]|jgi:hypothetical protein